MRTGSQIVEAEAVRRARELIAVDGARLKAVSSRDRNFNCAKLDRLIASADERLDDYLARLDRADRSDGGAGRDRAAVLSAKLRLEVSRFLTHP